MKWVYSAIVASLVLISAISVFLIKKGVSLRTAGVIKPSVISPEIGIVGSSVALRLFPDFSASDYVFWIYPNEDHVTEVDRIVEVASLNLKDPRQKQVKNLLWVKMIVDQQAISDCSTPCWIQISAEQMEILKPSLSQKFQDKSVFIYVNYFNRNIAPDPTCENLKVLNKECVVPISVREIHRKLEKQDRYFFMRRYLDHDFYLFLENP